MSIKPPRWLRFKAVIQAEHSLPRFRGVTSQQNEFMDADVPQFTQDDHIWMDYAITLAHQAQTIGEVPVGAVLVHQNQIIGEGFNQLITLHDPTAHAEITAIRNACTNLKNYRLPEQTTLYVTLEPCTMCVGALIHARVDRVIFASLEPKSGALVSQLQLMQSDCYNHHFAFSAGLKAQQTSTLLSDFFKARRARIKFQSKQQKI